MEHPDLSAEQAYITKAYEALDAMRDAARRLHDSVIGQSTGGTHQARFERDVFVEAGLKRLAQLELGHHALCFGRIDTEPGDTWYIGRLGVSDAHREPLVVDWRAPASEPFYRATAADPLTLRRRRHFSCEGSLLRGIEDEHFGTGEDADLGLSGPGALMAAIGQVRTGQMRDIVSTIQREQDEVIRDELTGALVVQGGPGTGKTAVLLHRVAYLLFTHRRYLEGRGVLVLGPNQVFLRYINDVLPALGESGAGLSTVAGLRDDVRATASEEDATVARLKGDDRMAKLIARAVADRQRPLYRDAVVPFDPEPLVLSVKASRSIVGRAKSRGRPHNLTHSFVEDEVTRRLYGQYASGVRTAGGAGRLNKAAFVRAIRREPEFRRTIDRMWPKLEPSELVDDLFISRPLLASAADGLLTDQQVALLHRPHGGTLHQAPWTAEDVPLVDEAEQLLGPTRPVLLEGPPDTGSGEEDDGLFPLYGHIAIDEAQDLSPMQLRMIARRSLSGSFTLVGDVAQATSPWFSGGWEDILQRLRLPHGSRVRELTVNYRTPKDVMDLAANVLAAAEPSLSVPRSVRETGETPRFVRIDDRDGPGVPDTLRAVVAEELEIVRPGILAVICPSRWCEVVAARLSAWGLPAATAGPDGVRSEITVLPMSLAKGLEFDAVVIVEPADLLDEAGGNLRSLYVSVTRTTRRLAIVHARPLPEPLHA